MVAACLTILASARQPSAATASSEPVASSQHIITIQADEGLQLTKQERKAWYQKGGWPVIWPVIPIVITSSVAIIVVFLQSRRSFNALLRQRRIDFMSSSLNDFYNPLLALLEINDEIFEKTGPKVFPKEYQQREAAAQVWTEMKKKVLANNQEVENILKTKTHLIYRSDSLGSYKTLLIHVAMYETFQKVHTDRYLAEFRFPEDIKDHIFSMQSAVRAELHALIGEQM